MSRRKLKPLLVDERFYVRGEKIELFLDRDDNTFFAMVGEEIKRSSLQELKEAVTATAGIKAALIFEPVIELKRESWYGFSMHEDAFGNPEFDVPPDQGLAFNTRRVWISKRPSDGSLFWCPWDTPEDRRAPTCVCLNIKLRGVPFRPPCNQDGKATPEAMNSADQLFLPYSETLWEGLQILQEKLCELRRQFDAHLHADAGLKALAEGKLIHLNALPERDAKKYEVTITASIAYNDFRRMQQKHYDSDPKKQKAMPTEADRRMTLTLPGEQEVEVFDMNGRNARKVRALDLQEADDYIKGRLGLYGIDEKVVHLRAKESAQ